MESYVTSFISRHAPSCKINGDRARVLNTPDININALLFFSSCYDFFVSSKLYICNIKLYMVMKNNLIFYNYTK